MFSFIKSNTPQKLIIASDNNDHQQIVRFENDTWNTILIRNIDLFDNNHQEHLLITLLENHVGKIKNIKDVYRNRYEKTISVEFEGWYKNEFTVELSDCMDKTFKIDNKKIYNQIELVYTENTNPNIQYFNMIEAV